MGRKQRQAAPSYRDTLNACIAAWVNKVRQEGEHYASMLGFTLGPDVLADVKRETEWWRGHGFDPGEGFRPGTAEHEWLRANAVHSLEVLLDPLASRDAGDTDDWGEIMDNCAKIVRYCAPKAQRQPRLDCHCGTAERLQGLHEKASGPHPDDAAYKKAWDAWREAEETAQDNFQCWSRVAA